MIAPALARISIFYSVLLATFSVWLFYRLVDVSDITSSLIICWITFSLTIYFIGLHRKLIDSVKTSI